jgi:hypothetical protein
MSVARAVSARIAVFAVLNPAMVLTFAVTVPAVFASSFSYWIRAAVALTALGHGVYLFSAGLEGGAAERVGCNTLPPLRSERTSC